MTEASNRDPGWIDLSGTSQDVIEAVEGQMADSPKGRFVGVLVYSKNDWQKFEGRASSACLREDKTSPFGDRESYGAIQRLFPEAMTDPKLDLASNKWEIYTDWSNNVQTPLFRSKNTKSHRVPTELGKVIAENNRRGRHPVPIVTDFYGPHDPDQYGTYTDFGTVLHLRGKDGKLTKESRESIEHHVNMYKPRSSVSASRAGQESN